MTLPDWDGYQRYRPQFEQALDSRLYNIQYVDSLVYSGRARFFNNEDAAIIVEIKVYPTGAMDVHGLLAAGELSAVLKLIPIAEKWGKSLGCIGALIESRNGWQRALKGQGYEPFQMAIRKQF